MAIKDDSVNNRGWDINIVAGKFNSGLGLRELLRYKDLLLLFVRRDLVALYKQTILGPLWFIIQPVIQSLMFYFVFNRVANISTDGVPPFLFYLAGTICWNYFADCLNKTSVTFSANAQIFGKVYFPRLIVPMSIVISNLVKLLVQFVLFLGVWIFYKSDGANLEFSLSMLLFPVGVLMLALLGLGFGLLISSFTTKYRDLKFLMGFGVQLWMYLTPVIYPYSLLQGTMQKVAWFNPVTHIVELFKYAFLGKGMVSLNGIIYVSTFTLIVLAIGIFIFNRVEKRFMDTV